MDEGRKCAIGDTGSDTGDDTGDDTGTGNDTGNDTGGDTGNDDSNDDGDGDGDNDCNGGDDGDGGMIVPLVPVLSSQPSSSPPATLLPWALSMAEAGDPASTRGAAAAAFISFPSTPRLSGILLPLST